MTLDPHLSLEFLLLSWWLFTTSFWGLKQLSLLLKTYSVVIIHSNFPPFLFLSAFSILSIQCFPEVSSHSFLKSLMCNFPTRDLWFSTCSSLEICFRYLNFQWWWCLLSGMLPGKRKDGGWYHRWIRKNMNIKNIYRCWGCSCFQNTVPHFREWFSSFSHINAKHQTSSSSLAKDER